MPIELLTPRTDSSLATSVVISPEDQGVTPFLTFAGKVQWTSSTGWVPLESSRIGEETRDQLPGDAAPRLHPEYLDLPSVSPSARLVLGERHHEGREPGPTSVENGDRARAKMAVPLLEGVGAQDPILSDSIRNLLRVLWSIVVSRALQGNFPLQRTSISVFEDPSEEERKAVLRVVCHASAAQAIAFWDSLEPDLQGWLRRLNERDRATFVTKIALRVHWV